MTPDAGLRAVARVRGVREQDSRLGLHRAHVEQEEARGVQQRAQADLHRAVAEASGFAGSGAAFAGGRAQLAAMGERVTRATAETTRATALLEAAHAHWQHQRTRLAAVELLLERRAQARREAVVRREAVELDEVATQRWRRGQAGR